MNQLFESKHRKRKSAATDKPQNRNDRRIHPERREKDRRASATQPILTEAEIEALLHGTG